MLRVIPRARISLLMEDTLFHRGWEAEFTEDDKTHSSRPWLSTYTDSSRNSVTFDNMKYEVSSCKLRPKSCQEILVFTSMYIRLDLPNRAINAVY